MKLKKIIALALALCLIGTGVESTSFFSTASEAVNELDDTGENETNSKDGTEQDEIEQDEVTKEEEILDSEQNEAAVNQKASMSQVKNSSSDEAESEQKENSWRYSDGEMIPQISTYANTNAWEKVNGFYVNNKGEVIKGAEKKGIDVSKHQGKIDWEKVKADGIEFAIIRCGYGMDQTDQDDEYWEYNVSECERLGIPYGVYLYSYATDTTKAASEAQHVLRLLKGHTPSYPVYLDMEDDKTVNLGSTMLGNIAKTFCDTVSAAGYRVGIYSNLNWWTNYLTSPVFNNSSWSKWVAQYNSECKYTGTYDMWQCTSTGSVDGIVGNVDLNFWMVKTYDVEPVEVEDTNIIQYSSHLQTFGWQQMVQNGYQSGVTGYSKRLEAFKIEVGEGYGDLGVRYQAHVQSYGWMDYVETGEIAGTTGEAKRVEAIKIELTGDEAANYDIYYRVHCQTYGWLDWAKNGEAAGTQGYSKRLEAIQIAVVPKGADAPGDTAEPFVKMPMSLDYSTYIAGTGWQSVVSDGGTSGTSGQSLSVEALKVKLSNADYDGDIKYETYMQTYGWTGEKSNYEVSGLAGSGKRVEAVRMYLTGEMADKYDIYYRAYVQTYGWLDWAKDGESAGTFDYAKRLEAIQIKLVEKGGKAPGGTEMPYKQALIKYGTHIQTTGWKLWNYDGENGGTTGQSKRLEAIRIAFADGKNLNEIQYKTHVQTYGWLDWVNGNDVSGTTGEAKRLEAIQIKLSGDMEKKYDIYYRVHAQTYGWLDWAKNGESAGTEGLSKRLEAIEIVLVEKGGEAPGKTTQAFIKAE